ncbi:DinB family protein [Deinococcus sp. QL22]|uniref:DinB family protein n=1 Tax=Deinococcus sp. QL22 TaxID=2939437 RepID=UPI0020176113|nr:DinB family protein [Deinococcus sp. QL22]UQN08666.1 DinB family protein [Deinococcus sp. QL22]
MAYPAHVYVQSFQQHRAALLELLDRIPPEHGDTTIWEGGRSITQTVDHLLSAGVGVVDMLSGGSWGDQVPSAALPEATARLGASTELVIDKLSALSDEELNHELTVFGGARWPAYRLVDFHREHEIHHKGQLWVMARVMGIEPPFFTHMV